MKNKKCPFCGDNCCVCSFESDNHPDYKGPVTFWTAHCQTCSCSMHEIGGNKLLTKEEAVIAWNTRFEEE